MQFIPAQQGFGEVGGEMAYDLRQTYAKIVGDHLEDIAQARKADKYSIYYKSLMDLRIIVNHKFKKNKELDDKKEFKELVQEAVKLANQYPNEWLGKSKDPTACSMIEQALNDIEMFLYSKIDDAGMFGGNKKISGL